MKRKVCFILFIVFLSFMMFFSAVYATNEESLDEDVIVDNDEDISEDIEKTVAEQLYFNTKEMSEENYYRLAEDITLEGKVINGNVFILASNVILKDVTVNGDIFICANKLKVEQEASLNGNVFVCSSNVEFDGKIARELYAVCKDLVFGENNTIMYNTNISADHVSVKGTFYRDLNASITKLEVKEGTTIFGTLNYASGKEASIEQNVNISNTNFELQIEEEDTIWDIIVDKILDFTRYFILTMLVFIVIMKFSPKTIKKAAKNLNISAFGLGIATLILVPILLVAFLLLRVFTTAVFAALALFILILIIAMAITTIAVAEKIAIKKPNFKLYIAVPVITFIIWVLYQIAFIGAVFAFIWITTGLGIAVKNCFTKLEE